MLRHTNEVAALCSPSTVVALVGLRAGHCGCIGDAAGLTCICVAWSGTARRVRDVG